MDEHTAPFPGSAEHGEVAHMLGADSVAIALGLDKPAFTVDDDLAVDVAVAGVAAIADDAMPAPFKGSSSNSSNASGSMARSHA